MQQPSHIQQRQQRGYFRRKTEMNSKEGIGEISLNLGKEYKLKMELGR